MNYWRQCRVKIRKHQHGDWVGQCLTCRISLHPHGGTWGEVLERMKQHVADVEAWLRG